MNPPVADRELEEAASAVESSARPAPPAATEPIKARIVGLQGYGFVSLALVSVIAALSLAQGFFIPVVVSVVIALALSRVVRRLSRWMPRWIASGLVVGFLLGGLGTLGYGLSDEGTRAIAGLPSATKSLRQAFRVMTNRQQGPLSQVQRAIDELERTASESTNRPATPSGVTPVQVIEPPIDVSNVVWLGSQGMLGVVAQLTLVVFLVYFLLTYGELFKRKIVRLSGASLARRKVTVQLIDEIGENVAKSISHLVLVSVVVGVATSGSLMLLDVRYAGLWGLAAGLFNLVPYVGPLIVAAGLFLASIVQFGDVAMAAMVAGVSVVITSVEGFLFTPIVFGRTARVNPVAVFVGFMFWGWLWGLWGLLLAMPLLLIIRSIADKVDELTPLAELLSD
ncbi:MAG TPA: AI-2E family transporter [Vicinamibacterales bacterium]|nr:AI-2E family transporter [Vicinamibacterales bacterium]